MTKKEEQKTEGRKHPGGRPRKYSTPEEMQIVIDKYFEDNPKPTICGLALALGFAQRKSLLNPVYRCDRRAHDNVGPAALLHQARVMF